MGLRHLIYRLGLKGDYPPFYLIKNMMNYRQFLFAFVFNEIFREQHLEVDTLWEVSYKEFENFDKSSYNDPNKDEYACIQEYLWKEQDSILWKYNFFN